MRFWVPGAVCPPANIVTRVHAKQTQADEEQHATYDVFWSLLQLDTEWALRQGAAACAWVQ